MDVEARRGCWSRTSSISIRAESDGVLVAVCTSDGNTEQQHKINSLIRPLVCTRVCFTVSTSMTAVEHPEVNSVSLVTVVILLDHGRAYAREALSAAHAASLYSAGRAVNERPAMRLAAVEVGIAKALFGVYGGAGGGRAGSRTARTPPRPTIPSRSRSSV